MRENWKTATLIPLLLAFFFLLDGVLTVVFSEYFLEGTKVMTPRLIILVLILMSFYIPRSKMLVYSLLFGLIYDSYYVGILGVYVLLFPLIIYLTEKLKKVLNPNPIVIGMMVIINLSLIETYLYLFYQVLGYTKINWTTFLADRLGPTLLLNLVLFIIVFYPLKKIIEHIQGE
ncbi:MAG: rod shape-determining protein MreD [Carnobacterium sp.]|uniref:rod shape-determining protein MreD n=1 Tax=Carnobacterium TaxID=2747 RepID=UPI0005598986|nr:MULTISPECIES: rod shape-determining protein MreD [Carnobacterium]MCM3512821.1 rod shape-determining protein MreD [Carnobacterium inhibens]MDN5373122.1 rod shape-determining protein MreD [Carnobacterium sp.]